MEKEKKVKRFAEADERVRLDSMLIQMEVESSFHASPVCMGKAEFSYHCEMHAASAFTLFSSSKRE